ncbi:MAG: Fe-S protein assembly co-chaperone HscB [Planctomycetota bacterium]|nr:Fe-S protein assembly co-chaperone HscB [Planctomycetota bacterium]
MNHVPAPDAFAVFGVPRALDLDANDLELRYLQLSRECHPDHHRSEDVGESVAVLQRAAEVNDAWNVLKDRWKRARALLEAEAPGVLEANKKLDPMFLADALELAEEVAFADGDRAAALTAQLRAAVDEDFDALQRAVADQDYAAAARRVHQSHYHQKALADLEAKS